MLSRLRDLLIGIPLPTQKMGERRLNKIRALAAFSPDALSSIAYANQEIYLGLVLAGSAGLSLAAPIGLSITLLLIMVALSYEQTIHAYPSGGGSWIVATQNLGRGPGLAAAAALMIDYLLTAAVSLTAGVEAISSAFPVLWQYRIWIAFFFLLVITLINLRGTRETGTLLSVPVYLFVFSFLIMLAWGVWKAFQGGWIPTPPPQIVSVRLLTPWLVLHTFATGCTALTGIEAISNGVPVFQPPESRNAGRTLMIMALLMGMLFFGSLVLTQFFGVTAGPDETILSALAHRLVGDGPIYYFIQVATMLILAVAANTSFAGFPRLAALLAKDRFLPRQFTNLGDRLVFSNGIVALAVGTAILILIFGGNTHALVPLFAVGAFLAFTLSQAGMVVHWWRLREHGWYWKMAINGLGGLATGTALIIIAVSKFLSGAWVSILLIPLIMTLFARIRSHYEEVGRELTLRGLPPSLRPLPPLRVVVPVAGVNRSTVQAVQFSQSISQDVTAVYIDLDPAQMEMTRADWNRWFPDVPLVILPSPFRSVVSPLIEFLDRFDEERNDGEHAAVVLPEFVPAHWWQGFLHNQTAFLIRTTLLYRRRIQGFPQAIIDVPFHLRR